uniref:Orphan protein n=1 Tax=Echinococcus granulosus TaxID=6210 RepID=A0A068WH85_ECHGR|nr:hypothetical protein EgrG_001053300 [Echinococcus granulosus]
MSQTNNVEWCEQSLPEMRHNSKKCDETKKER